MEFDPQRLAVNPRGCVTAAYVRRGIQICIELTVAIDVCDRRRAVGDPFAEVSWSRQEGGREKGRSLFCGNSAIDRVKFLDQIVTAIALGGMFSKCGVSETMSREITSRNHGQRFTAHLVIAAVVTERVN